MALLEVKTQSSEVLMEKLGSESSFYKTFTFFFTFSHAFRLLILRACNSARLLYLEPNMRCGFGLCWGVRVVVQVLGVCLRLAGFALRKVIS